jgi:hypothetical protein
MADDKRTPSSSRRRPAPTIDLPATEVKPSEPPTQDDAANQDPPQAAAAPPSKRPVAIGVVLGVIGGAAAVVAALWFTGLLQIQRQPGDNLAPRIAALETQAKAAQKPTDNPALAQLSDRIGKLEQAVSNLPMAAPDPASVGRLTGIDNAMKALGVSLAALSKRVEETAKTTDGLRQRLDGIERSAKATQATVAQNSGADAVARRALASIALRDAVMRGVPYAAELAVVKQLGADSQTMAKLEPFAQSGIPVEAALSHDITALVPALMKAAGADASHSGSFFDRLQANAGRLVRVRPIGEPAGDDPAAVIARIELDAVHRDLAGIDNELGKLPDQARVLAAKWREKLAARRNVVATARKLAADSAAALGAH